MAKKYWEGEYDINTDWGGDESTEGLPLPGSAVQDIIKTKLSNLDDSKVGYIVENESEGKVYFSTTKEAYDEGNYMGSVVSTPRYSLSLQEDENNKYIFLSSDSKKEFVWYFKTIEIATDSVYSENVTVEYNIKNKNDNTDKSFSTIIDANSDTSNSGFTKVVMNLDEYLTNGSSTLEIVVKGLRTKQERTLNRSFSIITLAIEDVTDFSKPFETNLIAQTNINCTRGQEYFYEYRFDEIGDFIFDSNSKVGYGSTELVNYSVNISELTEGKHIFEYKLFVKIDAESEPYYTNTQRIEFIKGSETMFNEPQILIFSSYSDVENPLASDGNLLINGVSQYIPYDIRCSVHNSDVSFTNVEFYEIVDGIESAPITTTIDNGTFFIYSIQSMEEGQKTIKVICKDIDENILNGEGRIFYINVESSPFGISEYKTNLRIDFSSVGKNNDSVDKETWVSNVDNGRFINNVSFSDTFDWSQGWTNNGLVLSDGCEITFDYAPFPQQKDSPTTEEANEYVGGDKAYTFEIEFMTQNVTNEDAVVCNMMDETEGGKCGLLITGSEFRFTTPAGESVSTRFKAEEMNRLTIIVRPYTTSTGAFKGLVELYINGVMSSIAKYTYDEKFEVFGKDELGNAISKNLCFQGAEGADIVIKYIRAYNGSMSSDDVVNNYIIYRDVASEMLNLYNKNNVTNDQGVITPDSVMKLGNVPILIFVGRTNADELATGDGNETSGETYTPGTIDANEENWYGTLEGTTDKKKKVDMDVIYYNPLDKTKNFKFVKAYITPQGTSSMYYPKKNYRIYTQKNPDTRLFLSTGDAGVLELSQMLNSKFGENEEDRKYEFFRGNKNKKKRVYSFKNNAQAVKCWCLKADFAETSSSHNTGVARLWGETLKNSTVSINNSQYSVFKTNAQAAIERNYNNNVNGDMPDIRTTIDGFPIVVFGKKSYADEYVFLGKYNFNNDKSTESVFGFCDIDNKVIITDDYYNYDDNTSGTTGHTLDAQLDQYMTCVETLDNGNALANFSSMDTFDTNWADAFEFRYPEPPEAPEESEYKDKNGNWVEGGEEEYQNDLTEFNEETLPYWENTHLKPFKNFAQWIYDTRWCDVNGNILDGLTEEEAMARKQKFADEKWLHLDVWKMAAYYIYAMRFGAVDQIVKNSMLTSEGPFAYDRNGNKRGQWDSTDVASENYGHYYKWYYINYDNDTVLGVKNDGHLAYGPEITRQDLEGSGSTASPIYAGYTSTLWNNFDYDEEFQEIIRIADQGISKTMTYGKTIEMFDVEQVGKWCERVYNKDAEYKYISPYMADWKYEGDSDKAENFTDKLFMLQGSRTAHRRWWLSRRFNLFDGKWLSGDFASRYVEVKCDYGSIGDTFGAIAGSNAYFGYQINNKTFGDAKGGVNQEYKAGETIEWELRKNIQIGDPIAIFGSTDLLELNLQGLSNNLSSVLFYFGTNADLGNKLERLILSVSDEKLISNFSYDTYSDDEVGTVNRKTGFEKLQEAYPTILESDFEDGGKYPTSETPYDATDTDSPKFYRTPVENEDGDVTYIYFVKVSGGIRNYSCKGVSFDSLDKLQTLKMAGYMGVPSLDLTKNKFITDVDVRYSSIARVAFSEGSRIKNFYASPNLTTLSFTRCDNVTLQNMMIDSLSLETDGGVNLTNITVNNSVGLNHDNEFKNFIIKWMKGGYGHKPTVDKSLVLRDVKWTGVTIDEIETIMEFVNGDENGKKAKECIITGIIEIGPEQLLKTDLEMFKKLENIFGGGLIIRIPYANIIIDSADAEIIAGQTAEYSCTLFPSANDIVNGGGVVDCVFVTEVSEGGDDIIWDGRNNKYYKEISSDEVRTGTSIKYDTNTNIISVKTTEQIVGNDIETIIMAKLNYEGETKFDVTSLVIKDPTYAVSGIINGTHSLNERNAEYSYSVSLTSNKNAEPIGTVNIEWQIIGDGVIYISNSAVSSDERTLTIQTNSDQPELTDNIQIVATIKNYQTASDVYPDFNVEKDVLILNENIILTNVSNPTVMAVCYAQGWAESEVAMSKAEGEAVTDIGTAFANISNSGGWSFYEFKYFTNENLTSLSASAFYGSDIVSITLPTNVTTIGNYAFANCQKLKTVELTESIEEIPEGCFLNCSSLEKFELPDNVQRIRKFAFGGAEMEKMSLKTSAYSNTNKVIYITEDSILNSIYNNAFETTTWTPSTTSNKLRDITLPNKMSIVDTSYNFLLSKYLETISLVDSEASKLLLKDNILFANKGESIVARALQTSNTIVDVVELPNTTTVFDYAFYNCESIKRVVFDYALYQYGLGVGVFYNSKITVVDLSLCELLTKIKEYTFYNCTELTNVYFPQNGSLYIIGYKTFFNSPYLEAIEFPDTVTSFEQLSNRADTINACGIKTFKLPENLLETPKYFLNECSELTELTFSKYFIIAQNSGGKSEMISKNENLTKVILPIFSTTVESDSYFIYRNDKVKAGPYLTEIEAQSAMATFEEIETEISPNANVNYSIIQYFSGETLVVNIDSMYCGTEEAFEECYNINEYVLNEKDNNQLFITDNNIALYCIADVVSTNEKLTLSPREDKIVRRVAQTVEEYTLLDNTTIINGAFSHCFNITSFTIPETVTIIEDESFYNCENLEEIIIGKNLITIGSHAFFDNKNLQKLTILSEKLEKIKTFAFCGCLKLSEILIKTLTPPSLDSSTSTEIINGISYKKYHPFGFRENSFVGFDSKENGNMLYVPYNNNGYLTNEDWIKPLQTPEACGFMVDYITLDSIVTLNGSLLNDYQVVYLKSDSGNFVNDGNVESTTKGENGFIIQFNGKVYDNETIYVYSDSGCTTLIGSFVAKYGVLEYTLDAVMSMSRSTTLFSSGLFGTSNTVALDSNTEMANITKLEYEILVSKVNQLMKLLKNKK